MKVANMKVNMKFLPMKMHYFMVFAGTAPLLPFLPVFARQQGFSPAGIGLIYTVLPFMGLLAKALLGALSDWFRIHRTVFLTAIIVCALGFFSIYFAPSLPQTKNLIPAKVSFDCSLPNSFFKYCRKKRICGIHKALPKKTASCKVECEADQDFMNSICTSWNLPELCNGTKLNFTAYTDMKQKEDVKLCTFLPLSNITILEKQKEYPSCPSLSRTNCTMVCNEKKLMKYLDAPLMVPAKTVHELVSQYQFWIFLLCFIIAWCGLAVTVTMSDTVCFQLLGAEPHRYGEQRLFGALGWGLLVVIAGALIDYVSKGRPEPETDYTPAFILSLAFLFVDLLIATRLQIEGQEKQGGGCGSVIRLIYEPHIVIFIVCCVIVGVSTGLLWTFQLMLVEDIAYKWSCDFVHMKLLEGLIMGVQCYGGELPSFFLSGKIIKKLGHVNSMSVVMGVFGLRFILYYTVSNPWLFLPIELLNGFTFGIFYATMTSYASVVAPLGTEATMQGIVGAAFEGVGIAIGGFVGGALFFTVGGSKTFLFVGFFNIAFTLLHIVLQLLLQRYKIHSSPPDGASPVGYLPHSESVRPVSANDDDDDDSWKI